MKRVLLVAAFIGITAISFAQNLKPVAQKVNDKKLNRQAFVTQQLFDITPASALRSSQLAGVVSGSTVLEFRQQDAQDLIAAKPENLNFVIPTNSGNLVEMELYRANFFTPDFSVTTSLSGGLPVTYAGGVHYWGIVKGDNNSIAAISVFDNEVMGMISTASGNFVLGKLENDATGKHIFYNDKNLNAPSPLQCYTEDDNSLYRTEQLQNPNKLSMVNCIRLFWEVDYDIFTGKGSVANAANYVTGLFNQSAIIYANDAIPVELSEVFVWNSVDPYTGTSTSSYLSQFQNYRNTINGDLGHLLGYGGGGGVAAGFSGICASNLNSSQCYSGVNSSYNNVPTYSWSVMVVTHEQGHLMGSRHTHACVWNGNNTAIDGCGPAHGYGYEGSCSGAPVPAGGGTIMSYCHLDAVGINLSLGFGTQPKNVILNNYNNGTCLTACIGTSCMPSANMTITNVLSTTATFNWAAVTGALSYNIQYRVVGAGTWQTGTSATTSYNAIGLTAGANYEWQVQTVCQTGTSIFTISMTFTTPPVTCNTPSNLSTTNVSYSSATFNWGAVAGATSYNIQYRIVGSGTWLTGTSTGTSYNAFSLVQLSNYEWQVQTVCAGGGTSAFSSSTLFTTTAQPCNTPQNNTTTNIGSTSATLYSSGATGGLVNIQYRIVGTPTWNSLPGVAIPYNLSGLIPLTNYEWQVQLICSLTVSGWSNSILFTTLCATPPAIITPAGNTTFCQGGSVVLNANAGAYSYQWQLNGTNISGQTSSSYTATASGSYTVIVTSGTCSATSSATIVTVIPVPTGTISGTQTICSGSAPLVLTFTGSGPWNFTVSDGSGSTNGVATSTPYTILVSPTTTTTYVLTAVSNATCIGTFSGNAIVTIGNINAAITPAGTVTLCEGSALSLSASTGIGYAYQWYKGTAAIAGATGATYTTGDGGTFYCVITSGTCTGTSNSVIVTKINNPNPTMTYSTPLTFCSPGSVTFTANTFAGVTYQWQKNSVDIAGATNQTYSATSTGKYRVKETANGCTKQGMDVQVNVNATSVSSVISANGPTSFCSGGSVVLSVDNAIPGYSYQWQNGGVNIAGATSNAYTATAAGVFTCVVSASCGTTTSNAITVTTSGIVALVTPSGNVSICNGATASLNANTGTGYGYQWMNNGVNISGATNATYNATAAGNYSVFITSPCGNATSAATVVNVQQLIASATPQATTICEGQAATFNANTGYAFSYQWYRNNVAIAGATSSSYATSQAATYKVVITQGGVCSSTSNNAVLTVINNPKPTITPNGPTTFCAGGSVTLIANSFAGVAYQWQKNSVNLAGATNQNYVANSTGQYRVIETANGCSKTATAIQITVNCRQNDGDDMAMKDWKVVPNPFTNELTVYGFELAIGDRLELIDIVGKSVLSQIITSSTESLNLHTANLNQGVYFLQVMSSGERKTIKVVKQ